MLLKIVFSEMVGSIGANGLQLCPVGQLKAQIYNNR
jgi:hypothetical protein